MSIGFVGLVGFVTYSSHFWFSIFVKTSSFLHVSLGLKGLNGKTPRLN